MTHVEWMTTDLNKLPLTMRAKKVLYMAIEEAKSMGHSWIGTEHILLSMLKEGDGTGMASIAFQDIKVEYSKTREAVEKLLGVNEKNLE